jgi:hypothetical protein
MSPNRREMNRSMLKKKPVARSDPRIKKQSVNAKLRLTEQAISCKYRIREDRLLLIGGTIQNMPCTPDLGIVAMPVERCSPSE